MKIVKTPIIKSKQEQDTTSEIHKRYKEWEKFDSLIYRGKFEEIQKVEGGKSEQVLPAEKKLKSMEKAMTKITTNRQRTRKLKIMQQKMCIRIIKHQMEVRPKQAHEVKQGRKKKATPRKSHRKIN